MPDYFVDVDVSVHMLRTYLVTADTPEEAERSYQSGEVVSESNTSDELEEIEGVHDAS